MFASHVETKKLSAPTFYYFINVVLIMDWTKVVQLTYTENISEFLHTVGRLDKSLTLISITKQKLEYKKKLAEEKQGKHNAHNQRL